MIDLLNTYQNNNDEGKLLESKLATCRNARQQSEKLFSLMPRKLRLSDTWRFNKSSSKKAQFMIITIVLIGITFFTMFLLVRTVDRSSVVMFEQTQTGFENLRNSVIQRNTWMGSYWWNLNWENRSIIDIITGATNPIMIDPEIPEGINCNNEVRVTTSDGTELESNVNSELAPCNVIFNAPTPGTGIFYVYWNNPSATPPAYRGELPEVGNPPSAYTVLKEVSPKSNLCPHLVNISIVSERKLSCNITNIFSNTKVNYTVGYTTPGFSFSGFLN